MDSIRSRHVASELVRFYKTARCHIFRTAVHQDQFLFFEIFDLPGYNFCDEHFVFHANAVIPVDVEDLPTEAIQRTNSLIGPCLTCPRDIDGSESVRPFPSVVQGIAWQNYLRTTFWGVLRKTSA